MEIRKYRDLTLVKIDQDKSLVIACDSSGGIGSKENDVVKAEPEVVGYFGAQVCLMELISFGATLITLVDTLSVEMDGYGSRILQGIKRALEPLDIDESALITGSTEENIPVSATGFGITAIGIIENRRIEKPPAEAGDVIVLLGEPRVGQELAVGDIDDIMTLRRMIELLRREGIKEIVPVGSKGALYEINTLKELRKFNYRLELGSEDALLHKSGGPATAAIGIITKEEFENLKSDFGIGVKLLGRIVCR